MIEFIDYDYSKLKAKIVEEHYTIKSLAKATAVGRTSLSQKLNNHSKVGFSQREMQRIANVLDINFTNISDYFFAPPVRKNVQKREYKSKLQGDKNNARTKDS